jgi:hypothetical protein
MNNLTPSGVRWGHRDSANYSGGPVSSFSNRGSRETARQSDEQDRRLDRLIDRLPRRLASALRFLQQPSRRWMRIPAGLLLIVGGVFSFLPILGIWMLPLGLVLLADDLPALRWCRSRILDWVERRHPNWLTSIV